jgi:hypothetical protein
MPYPTKQISKFPKDIAFPKQVPPPPPPPLKGLPFQIN